MDPAFASQLAQYGPHRSYAPMTLDAARFYCAQLTRSHYENFSVASILLPRRLLPHFQAVYAYCRWADDLGDETGGGAEALSLLRWWRGELLDCYAGRPHHPVMVALHETIQRFRIPNEPFLRLLFAFEQDQLVKRYRSLKQLHEYCRYSANPVGHLVLHLCECYDDENARLSDFICTGLQLANFWQDVARDYDIGRVYLPEDELRRFGYGEDDLKARRFNLPFRDALAFLVDHARELFRRGQPLIARIPHLMRADIELFALGGLGILRAIEQGGYNVWKRRPTLSRWAKAQLILRVAWRKCTFGLGW